MKPLFCKRADINSFFAHKVCMNLDRRPERWARMKERFAKHNITGVVRFSAVDGERLVLPPGWQASAGAYGCLQTNIAIVKEAAERGWPEVLILEDDVIFDDNLETKFPEFISQAPADWDMLFFGCMHRREPVRVCDNVLKLSYATSTYAYAVRETVYSAFAELHSASRQPIDANNRLLQERFNCYSFSPHLAWVEGGHSDTHGRPINPWWLKESISLVGRDLDLMQSRALLVIPHRDRTPERLGVRNLNCVVNRYGRLLKGMTIAVVEQDQNLSLAYQRPEYCWDYIPIRDGGPFNRGLCFNEAVRRLGADKEFYIFADRDMLVGWEVKANLRKCLEYDFVSSFEQLIDLNEEDTNRVINLEQIDGSAYMPRPRSGICAEFCTFTRAGFERVGGWDEACANESDYLQSQKVKEQLSVFESPGWAFRLFSGESRGQVEQR
ncbi:MAG TPA: glycosyltransferase family 25 protein [Blastocatellia bacterium]|nr:glycosyltransferase family 25 protein [Blastocatellia bacterium]